MTEPLIRNLWRWHPGDRQDFRSRSPAVCVGKGGEAIVWGSSELRSQPCGCRRTRGHSIRPKLDPWTGARLLHTNCSAAFRRVAIRSHKLAENVVAMINRPNTAMDVLLRLGSEEPHPCHW